MITLISKNERGDIRLVAVDAKCRGKNSAQVIYAALKYFIKKDYTKAQVVTQKSSTLAIYTKMGFRREKIDNFYHFWLPTKKSCA